MYKSISLFIRKKFFYKVYSLVSLVLFIMILIVILFTTQQQSNMIKKLMFTQGQVLSKSIEVVNADSIVLNNQAFIIEHSLNVIKNIPNVCFIIVSKNDSNPILIKANSWKVLSFLPKELNQYDNQSVYSLIIKNPFSALNEDVYLYSYPIIFNNIYLGRVNIGFCLDEISTIYRDMYKKLAFLFFTLFALFSIVIYFISINITKPIIELNNITKKILKGGNHYYLKAAGSDEIGELTNNFNLMLSSIKKSEIEMKEYNKILEERVIERTKELASLNISLDERVKSEISKQQAQEQILIHQARFAAMGEMIGNIAHQWRQPLNVLSLLLQNCIFSYRNGSLDTEYIDHLENKGNSMIQTMSTTIDDFRNFFDPNKKKVEFNINDQIEKSVTLLKGFFLQYQIDIKNSMQQQINAFGYANEFSQVILNILTNAKDALIEKNNIDRNIYINGNETSSEIFIEISDTAGGIPKEIIEKVFDPYFTTKEEGKGTGIGLYMSKVIIENNMGGTLCVNNNDTGAVFIIRLPKSSASQENI